MKDTPWNKGAQVSELVKIESNIVGDVFAAHMQYSLSGIDRDWTFACFRYAFLAERQICEFEDKKYVC